VTGAENWYVLTADGTVGFVDTMKDPGQIDRQVAGDLLSFMIGLLADDQDAGRAALTSGGSLPGSPLSGMFSTQDGDA
jgi:hypothetical protein